MFRRIPLALFNNCKSAISIQRKYPPADSGVIDSFNKFLVT